ncbi:MULTISPECIES: hypothetical protein [unclassified Caballeronia]|uniref:hypothetical protein n=1 Tax=unclassified Caballeronia TaxID=2646786 RepID=UPI0038572040
MGRALARGLAAAGASVVVNDCNERQAADLAARLCDERHRRWFRHVRRDRPSIPHTFGS